MVCPPVCTSWLRHSWKSLPNRLTREKIDIHGNPCIMLCVFYSNLRQTLVLTVQVMINHHCLRWCPCPWQATNHSLQWRHNGRDGVSNQKPHDYSLNLLFRCRSKKTLKLRVTGLWAENFPHKRPVKRKMLPFDDVIMLPESKLTKLNKTCSNFSKPGFCLTLRDALSCLISSSVILHVITKPISYHTYF